MRPGAPPVEADGWAPGHHGELLQGSFTVADASPRPGLVTLPCPLVGSQATFTPGPHPLVVIPPSRRKARRAAQQCCDQLGVPARGTLVIRSAVPMARGFGSSTADVTAAIRAVATAHRRRLSAHDTARIAVAAEHAADPTMHGRPHLFDPETGRVIATAARRLPVLSVLGLDLAPEGPGVDTLATPRPPYSAAERDRFAELWDDLSQAVRRGDRTMIGKVATCSAEMHQRHRPTATFGDLIALAQHHRALGVQVAHSGTIAGVIFAPDQPHGLRRCRTALEDILGGPTWRFDTRAVQP